MADSNWQGTLPEKSWPVCQECNVSSWLVRQPCYTGAICFSLRKHRINRRGAEVAKMISVKSLCSSGKRSMFVNQLRDNRTTASGWSANPPHSSTGWSGVRNFFQRQPEWVLAGTLVGGALLAYLATKGRQTSGQKPQFNHGYGAPRERMPENEPLWRTPSARMGATEDQMEELATPSTRALDAGTAGATGAAYELDPASITGG